MSEKQGKQRIMMLEEVQLEESGVETWEDFGEYLRGLIQKYAMGQDIWFTYFPAEFSIPHPTMGQYSVPALRIYIGTHGALLGKENNVWFFMTYAFPASEEDLIKGILGGMENLRQQKSSQLNGMSGMKPQGPAMPFPFKPPEEGK